MTPITFLDLELRLDHIRDDTYRLTLTLRDSAVDLRRQVTLNSAGQLICFDHITLAALREQQLDLTAYGQQLGDLLFAQPEARAALRDALTEARSHQIPLQLRLQLSPYSPLHGLRWEALREPEHGHCLATLQEVIFARALTEGESFPAQLVPRNELRALVVIASPHNIGQYGMAMIDRTAETARAQAGLAHLGLETPATVIPGTRAALAHAILQQPDLLYLLAHGELRVSDDPAKPEPILWFENAQGQAEPYRAEELITLIASLAVKPRLVVLASCFSGGEVHDDLHHPNAEREHRLLATLAPRLASVGVPMVIGARGLFSVASAQILLDELFTQLARDGLVDRAFAAARMKLLAEQRADWWAPVLFMRQRHGRLWQPLPPVDVLPGVLQRLLPTLESDDLQHIAEAVRHCTSSAQIPLTDYATFAELIDALHFFDANSPAFAQLCTALDQRLPRSVPWLALAQLCRWLRPIHVDEPRLRNLAAICSGNPNWSFPSVGAQASLVALAHALATLPLQQPEGRLPLASLVDQLGARFADLEAVQQQRAALDAWRHRMAPATHRALVLPTQQESPTARWAFLLIQVTPALEGLKAPDHALPTQPEAFLAWPLFVEAWLFPEYERPDLRHQLLPDPQTHDAEAQAPNFTVATLQTELTALIRQAAERRPDLTLVVELLLPIDLMLLDVDQWLMPAGSSRFDPEPLPLGQSYHLAIRALERYQGEYRQRLATAWRTRWAKVEEATALTDRFCWIVQHQEASVQFLRGNLINREDFIGVAQALAVCELRALKPDLPAQLIFHALDQGVAAIVLVRSPKGDAVQAKAALQACLEACRPAELVDQVFKWRNHPQYAQQTEHYSQNLTLLWDDPRRLPPGLFEQPG